MALSIKEDPAKCAIVCDKSWVILVYLTNYIIVSFLLTWMSTQGMALKATDWRRELLGDTGSISRQESSLVLWLSFEELWWWWYSGLFELDDIWLVLDNSLSVMLDEILLKLAANLSMRKVSLILGLSQLFDLRRCVHVNFIEIWFNQKIIIISVNHSFRYFLL